MLFRSCSPGITRAFVVSKNDRWILNPFFVVILFTFDRLYLWYKWLFKGTSYERLVKGKKTTDVFNNETMNKTNNRKKTITNQYTCLVSFVRPVYVDKRSIKEKISF